MNDLIQRFKTGNTKADLGKLYETIERTKSKIQGNIDVIFGMEATGIYSLPLYSALRRDGYKVKLYNPIQTNGFRKMKIRKTRTDHIDAAIIADLLRNSEQPQVNEIKDLNLYKLRELVRIRHRLIEKQTVCKVQLIRNIDMIWPNYVSFMPKVFGTTSMTVLKKYPVPSKLTGKSFEQFYDLARKASRSKLSRTKAQEIYASAGNI